MKSYVEVIKPGQLSLIQDFGRFGLAHLGITQGGPLDDYAYSWANHLLDNPVNCPTIEITLGQAEFHFNGHCNLAIAGGDLNAKLDGQRIDNWSTFVARKGQTLSFGLPANGLRSYLAIKGGFDVSPVLGSVSTVTREALGGLEQGRALKAGDQLAFTYHPLSHQSTQISFRYRPDYNLPIRVRVIEGYQSEQFSPDAIGAFYSRRFEVSQHINRMGYRLRGNTITPPDTELLSEGIALGAIQVPKSGDPIILLSDKQTIGGYPKLGCVARIDLPRIAQARPGQTVTFEKGDLLGLQDVWCQWARFFGY